MPMLWAFKSPTHNKAAMEASTAEPFFFKMSLKNTRMHLTSRKHTCRTRHMLWVLLPPHFWTLASISSHSSLGVEVVWRGRRVFPPQAHEHPQKQADCSHQKDHQTSNQGLPNHFPAQERPTQLVVRQDPPARDAAVPPFIRIYTNLCIKNPLTFVCLLSWLKLFFKTEDKPNILCCVPCWKWVLAVKAGCYEWLTEATGDVAVTSLVYR